MKHQEIDLAPAPMSLDGIWEFRFEEDKSIEEVADPDERPAFGGIYSENLPWLDDSFCAGARRLWNEAEEAVKDDPVRLSNVRMSKMAVLYVPLYSTPHGHEPFHKWSNKIVINEGKCHMNTTRRTVFKGLLAAGTLPLFGIGNAGFGESRQKQLAKGAKTRIAIIGCGDWGRTLLDRAGIVGGCELVALCEPDPAAIGVMYAQCARVWGRDALVKPPVFADYREMFAKLGDSLDAVFIATPNHHHALPALMAIRRGIAAFIEKPMAHTLEEVLLIEREAKKTGAVVRVGNKGHNISHRSLLAKYLKDGVIGDVTEVFSFSDRPNTMLHRPHDVPVPPGMNWDIWCGGSPVCKPYGGEEGRVGLHPHDWHSWIDYGNGSIGNMGTHVLDAPYQTMDMWKVTPSKIEVKDVAWGCEGAWNKRGTMDFTIPARDGWGEIVLHWNDGIVDGVEMGPKFMSGWYNRVYRREHTNFPEKLVELERKWGVKKPIPAFGTVFVGTKGMIYEEFHRTLRFFPEGGRIADIPVPGKDELNAEELKIVAEFLDAVRGNPGPVNTGLDFSIPLAKTLMLANMLAFAGKGTYGFDGEKTDSAVANARARHGYRNGWDPFKV